MKKFSGGTALLSQLQSLHSSCNNLVAAEPNSPAAVIDSGESRRRWGRRLRRAARAGRVRGQAERQIACGGRGTGQEGD